VAGRIRWVIAGLAASLLGTALASTPAQSFRPAQTGIDQHSAQAPAQRCAHRNTARGSVTVSDWVAALPPAIFNPIQGGSHGLLPAPSYGLFDELFRIDNRARLFPMMAARLATIANGDIQDSGRTVRIRLRPGLRWSDGREITAADVRFGWRVEMDPATGPWCAGTCDVISSIGVPDRYTAVLHVKRVYAPLLSTAMPLPWPASWPHAWNSVRSAARELGKDQAYDFLGPQYPTDGPYQVVRKSGGTITMQPMPHYDNMVCGAFIRTVRFTILSSLPALMAAAANHRTDATDPVFSPFDLLELRRHIYAYTLHVDPSLTMQHVEFNLDPRYRGRPNPLSNLNVRRALALAVDRVGLVQRSLGFSPEDARNITAWTFLVSTPRLVQPFAETKLVGQWDPIAGTYSSQPGQSDALAHARQLLAATPWKHGFSMDFYTLRQNYFESTEGVLAGDWARLGVYLRAHFLDPATLFADWSHGGVLAHGDFQGVLFYYGGAFDPDGARFIMQSRYIDRRARIHQALNQNEAGIDDPMIDRAFDRAAQTFDPAGRATGYSFIQERVNKRAYWIPLYFLPIISTSDRSLKNFSINAAVNSPLWDVYAWKTSKR
jgi:peptide/nickel transport system substrate-binding protein